MSQTYKLYFEDAEGATRIITVPFAKDTLVGSDVRDVMETILGLGICFKDSDLTEIKKADLVEVVVRDIAVN